MTKRIDPREADVVVAQLRAANPVRRTATSRVPAEVDAFLLRVMERTDMVQEISNRPELSQDGRGKQREFPKWASFAAGFALAALIAVPMLLLGGEPSDPILEGLPPTQADLAADLVAALNSEDFEAFQSLFSSDGAVGFETGLHRPYHSGVESGQPIPTTDEAGFAADFAWGAELDRRVSLRTCESQDDRIFRCEINFGFEAWRAEWVEAMSVALAEDGRIALLLTEPLDPDPAEREQPLSLIGFFEFEDWLRQRDLEEYQRLIDPGTPGSIMGVEILLAPAPQNPDLVDELTALVNEYLAER